MTPEGIPPADVLDPTTIKVDAWREEEVEADWADLFVVVKGTSLVTGKAALTKAREVGELVAALVAAGLEEKDVRLQELRADKFTGLLGRSSSAHYSLRIRCAKLDLLPEVLAAVTSQKSATIQYLTWGYRQDDELRDRLTEAYIRRASERARLIAAALGVKLLGLHRYKEEYDDSEARRPTFRAAGATDLELGMMRSIDKSDFGGLDLSHVKRVAVRVEVEYRVGDRQSSESPPRAPAP